MKAWQTSLRKEKTRAIATLLWVVSLYGFILLAYFAAPPSESGTQVLFGLSLARLIVAGTFLFLLTLNLWAAVAFSGKRADEFESTLRALISPRLTPAYACLFSLALLTGTVLLSLIPPAAVSLRFLEPLRLRMLAPLLWVFPASLCLAALIRILYADGEHAEFLRKTDRALLIAGIFLFTFFSYEHFAASIGWVNKTRYSYWNLLAGEFLEGRLYLQNPPASTHDLTPYNGRWYVPSPPVPAIVMMPLVWLFGAEKISTMDFSIFFSAINAVLVFLVLERFTRKQWLKLSTPGALWLTALFIFGTPHLWVGISGRFWFVSQILTVTFLALAVLGALHSQSPWLLGLWIGLAVGTRPNGLMTLPFVFAIAVQQWRENGEPAGIKRMAAWALQSAFPIGAAVLGLLFYNHARFENFLDFGYTAISGDAEIVKNAQTYGLFSPHYIVYNLKVMFLYLPEIVPNGRWLLLPSGAGMSVFLTTPALLYLFHRYENKTWVWGAWAAAFLNFALLVMYHNSGRDQFGYRYILDALLPLTLLLASAFGKKPSRLFIALVIASILVNLYGANWFMNG